MPNAELGMAVTIVLLIRVGQTLLLAGCVRSKNAAGMAVRCVLDLAVVVLAMWAIAGLFVPTGAAARSGVWLAWGQLLGNGGAAAVMAMLLPSLLILPGALIGATAERVRVAPLLVFVGVIAAFVLPILVRFSLSLYGYHAHTDADLIVATVGGGAAALAMAWVAGPRKGKFNRDLSVNFVPGHATVYQLIGLLLLAAGWAATTQSGLHTLLGFAAALLAGAAFGRIHFGKIDAGLLVSAGVGGLAAAGLAATPFAATPVGGVSVNWLGTGGAAAVLAGAIAGAAVPWAVVTIEMRLRIDDAAGLGGAYAVGGTIGMIVVALTRRAETVARYFTGALLDAAVWLLAVMVIGGLAFVVAQLFQSRGALRVSETVEYDGVDLSDLDVNAYPDFQQTMIKSHHLRQL